MKDLMSNESKNLVSRSKKPVSRQKPQTEKLDQKTQFFNIMFEKLIKKPGFSMEKPSFSVKNWVFHWKTRVFDQKTQFFIEKPDLSPKNQFLNWWVCVRLFFFLSFFLLLLLLWLHPFATNPLTESCPTTPEALIDLASSVTLKIILAKMLFFPWDFRLHPEKELYLELYMHILRGCVRVCRGACRTEHRLYGSIWWSKKGSLGEKFIYRPKWVFRFPFF